MLQNAPKLVFAPSAILSRYVPWVWWVLQQIISLPYPVTSH